MEIDTPANITHLHILVALATELQGRSGLVRVLDAGCGDGQLMGYLQANLPRLVPGVDFEIHGFDVADHGVQKSDFFERTLSSLTCAHSDVLWADRLRLINGRDAWPYDENCFDAVVSNQVLEHVNNHGQFFESLSSVLREGGISIHLFPLVHYWYEAHLNLPFVHWIKNHDLSKSYIRMLSRIGLGKFSAMRRTNGVSLDVFSEQHADYMLQFTNYLTYSRAMSLGKQHGLRGSSRYTAEFYAAKFRSLLRSPPLTTYEKHRRNPVIDRLSLAILCRLSNVTLLFEKKCTYGRCENKSQTSVNRAA